MPRPELATRYCRIRNSRREISSTPNHLHADYLRGWTSWKRFAASQAGAFESWSLITMNTRRRQSGIQGISSGTPGYAFRLHRHVPVTHFKDELVGTVVPLIETQGPEFKRYQTGTRLAFIASRFCVAAGNMLPRGVPRKARSER